MQPRSIGPMSKEVTKTITDRQSVGALCSFVEENELVIARGRGLKWGAVRYLGWHAGVCRKYQFERGEIAQDGWSQ